MDKFNVYSITDEIKKELGYIIRQTRLLKYHEAKKDSIIELNPYTKENFCENNMICHYHTLTRLENDAVLEDELYHVFLNKLGLSFQIESEEHDQNMRILFDLQEKVIYTIEYVDHDMIGELNQKINSLNFDSDVIAKLYLNLLIFTYELKVRNNYNILPDDIESYIDLFKGVYKALAYQSLGNYYLIHNEQDKAIHYFMESMNQYNAEQVSPGLGKYPLLTAYIQQGNHGKAIHLAMELEEYYIETNNTRRLISVYDYLSLYHLIINGLNIAKDYYEKSEELEAKDPILNNYMLHYHWGMYYMKKYRYEEALPYFIKSYDTCKNVMNMVGIINRLIIINKIFKNEIGIPLLIDKGKESIETAPLLEQYILRYFIYQQESSSYTRRFAFEKLIPALKEDLDAKVILLFIYEDLFTSRLN